jgi:hypothetical protein
LEHEKQQLGPAFSETYADSSNEARGFEFRASIHVICSHRSEQDGTQDRSPAPHSVPAGPRACIHPLARNYKTGWSRPKSEYRFGMPFAEPREGPPMRPAPRRCKFRPIGAKRMGESGGAVGPRVYDPGSDGEQAHRFRIK